MKKVIKQKTTSKKSSYTEDIIKDYSLYRQFATLLLIAFTFIFTFKFNIKFAYLQLYLSIEWFLDLYQTYMGASEHIKLRELVSFAYPKSFTLNKRKLLRKMRIILFMSLCLLLIQCYYLYYYFF